MASRRPLNSSCGLSVAVDAPEPRTGKTRTDPQSQVFVGLAIVIGVHIFRVERLDDGVLAFAPAKKVDILASLAAKREQF
jgi:hypothetical protein